MKKKWTRAMALLCTLALVLTLAVPGFAGGTPAEEQAPEGFAYGEFMQGTEIGSDYEWKLDEDGTLTIRGTRMWGEDVGGSFHAPWSYFCKDITCVIIEDGIENIGVWAFYDSNSLTSITIPESVTSIGDGAFSSCDGLTSITIPEGVTSIDASVFWWCSSLTSITIPEGVTSIGENAFCKCTSLTSLTIPEGVTSIGENAFCECNSLTSLTLPSSLTSIGESAFDGCCNLTSITIPVSVKSIGNDAFSSGVVGVTYYAGGYGYICQRNKGNAPQFELGEDFGEAVHFGYIAATVYYPQNDATWTEAVRQQYGGTLTWVAYDPANPPDMNPESPVTPDEPETPVEPEQPAQPETPANTAPEQIADDLAQQVIAAAGNYNLARQLLESLLGNRDISVSARITEAMRLAIEAVGGIGRGHQVTDSAYVYATYPQSFAETLRFARAEVNAAANSFTLDMNFPEGKQSPLGVYMTVYLKEAFDPTLEYRWYCDDGSVGAARVEACENNGYKACAKFYAPHFSTYTVQPVSSGVSSAPVDPGTLAAFSAPADAAEAPVLKRTGGDVSPAMGIVLALAVAAVLGCVPVVKKKRKTR